jgi:hypothetical protein
MNGFNLNQFVLGFAIARPLADQRDRVMVGLAASMFPASNPLGAIFLKPQVDALSACQSECESLKQSLSDAAKLLGISKIKEVKAGGKEELEFALPVTEATTGDKTKLEVERDGRKLVLKGVAAGANVPITVKVGSFELATSVTVK